MPAIETFVQYYEKARYHLQAGKLRIAHGYLLKTIDLNPDFLDAYHLLGEVLRKLDRYNEATDIMTRLDKAVGFDPEVKLELARLEQAQNKYKKARRILLQILKRAPGHIESYCLLGDIYRAESNYKKAEEFYGKCLEIEPSHWGSRRGINEMLRHPIENKTNGKNGVDLESQKDLPVHSLEKRMAHAIDYLNQGKSGKALSLLRELEHKHPDHEMVALALAQALEAGGKVPEALKHLLGYLENQDQSAMIHFQCGHYCRTLKDLEQSREHFQKALQIDNDYYEAHFELAVVCHQLGDLQAARESYQNALELMPEDLRLHVNLAHLALSEKKEDEAEQWLKKSLQINSRCQEALLLLGNLFYGRKELRQAQACYQNLVRINPQNLRYLRLLAQTSQRLRDFETALQAWEKAAALVPEDETIRGIVGKLEKLVTVQPTDD